MSIYSYHTPGLPDMSFLWALATHVVCLKSAVCQGFCNVTQFVQILRVTNCNVMPVNFTVHLMASIALTVLQRTSN